MDKQDGEKQPRYVVVTDSHRGIMFGELVEWDRATKTVVLRNARHCFGYVARGEAAGTWSLATHGPQPGSRVSPIIGRHERTDVSGISDCTDVAVERWHAAGWGV